MKSALYRYPHPHDPTRFIYVGQVWDADRINIRHNTHRLGKEDFGNRFKNKFPGVELSLPIYEFVEVQNQLELNELETIWMFRFHTWRGYIDGENLTLPGSHDYKRMAEIPRTDVEIGRIQALGKKQGRKNVESGHLANLNSLHTFESRSKAGKIGGRIRGRQAVESGYLASIRTIEGSRKGGRKAVESGQLDRIRELPQAKLARSENGRKNVENGHLDRIRTTEGSAQGGRTSSCLQWNIRRGKPCTCGKHLVL